jgi:hypothetical protein
LFWGRTDLVKKGLFPVFINNQSQFVDGKSVIADATTLKTGIYPMESLKILVVKSLDYP